MKVEVNIPKQDSCIACSACKSEGDYYEYCAMFGHCVNWKGTSWKPTKECYDKRKETTEDKAIK